METAPGGGQAAHQAGGRRLAGRGEGGGGDSRCLLPRAHTLPQGGNLLLLRLLLLLLLLLLRIPQFLRRGSVHRAVLSHALSDHHRGGAFH